MIRRVAITGSIYPDPQTHIETVVYGDAGDGVSGLFTLLTGDGHADHAAAEARRRGGPASAQLAKTLNPRGWSERTIIVLVMQSLDNAIALRASKGRGGRVRLRDRAGPGAPEPDVHPGRQRVRRVAGEAHGRARPELDHGGGGEHPVAPRTSSAAP